MNVVTESDSRERILAAGVQAFAEVGYLGTSTSAIARSAGVTQPLVHHYFKSKDGVWRAAVDRVFGDVALLVPADDEMEDADVLRVALERFVSLAARRPELTRILARESTRKSERLTYLIETYLRAPFERVLAVLRRGQRAGLVAPQLQPELLLFFFLGAAHHMFDVGAFAFEMLGLDVKAPATRTNFIALVHHVLHAGAFTKPKES